MHSKYDVISLSRIIVISLIGSLCVLGISLLLQWFVYEDWLQQRGPIRIIGTSIATVVTFAFVLRWQFAARQRQKEMTHRFEVISGASDRIRNAVQAVACVSYVHEPQLTNQIRQALCIIDNELRGVVRDVGVPKRTARRRDPLPD